MIRFTLGVALALVALLGAYLLEGPGRNTHELRS